MLTYKKYKRRPKLHTMKQLLATTKDFRNAVQEHLFVYSLDADKKLISRELIFKGLVDECTANVGLIMRSALISKAAFFVVIHNHPLTNKAVASGADYKNMLAINMAAELLSISKQYIYFHDYIIVTKKKHKSLINEL
jgi:DNA repair protein RadC